GTLARGAVEEVKARVLRDQLGRDPNAEQEKAPARRSGPKPGGSRSVPRPRKPGMRDNKRS
ncbi:MAG: pseudouridine synthase, partial [Roseinatronobacter sp.]